MKILTKNSTQNLVCLSLLTIILCINCGQKSSVVEVGKKNTTDSIGTIYEFDTTKYIRHKSGFYLSKSRDVFQFNKVAYDDTTGFWSDHYWLDSTMFFGEYPDRKALKEIIDLETFESDTLSRFERDKKKVYYAYATSDGMRRFVVEYADPNTFKSIGEKYGKDKSHIYYGFEIVKGADLKTFKVLKDQDSAKDKRYVYHLGEKTE